MLRVAKLRPERIDLRARRFSLMGKREQRESGNGRASAA
jgi:hypothetical protein